ncbi:MULTISPECIES: type VI secretion system baseplate subunit TssG [unclassified Pseudomonas]|uniref:type VI secretion system baseplate subunit TssG n=1 Tax=unclassified Pseudomonas TaxID=196821 RepID=UPI0011999851|nr:MULTISPECIES: type VI secretion system baseplate subunit TssG [unclassified Pseudomonas]TWC06640.1 type VI secretion system protein ImpH [Pseudomonas sp. SJZ075]TWC26622.1 type VI secretion system protein ImpH [Pseudomonas sp. SJZ078]TWC45371.1 type VI secretion system protein ImpH [Pseudomonas sp. SJZ124]TWC46137.1 type VI secretion system protein ImpH [Pseudomonas sp. SJZ080]TWC80452.1 type VI secretion system protein ImpH [Pseudomonas sp. SJZ101]
MHEPLSPWTELQQHAWRFDFFSALRRIEGFNPKAPRLGTADHLHQDPVRLAQAVSLAFEPSMLRNLQLREGLPPCLAVTFFGLTGVNGPMPLSFSEDALSRQINHNDFVLTHFLDIFHHRLLCLLYRSWAVTRPVVSADRPDEDRFADYVQVFAPRSESYYASQYIDQRGSAEGLLVLLRDYLQVPVSLHQWHGRWSVLAADEQLQLGAGGACSQLGNAALLGRRAWNVQHSVRLSLGPLRLDNFMRFLPGSAVLRRMVRLVDDYLGGSFEWDLQLLLSTCEKPALCLGEDTPLGMASWLSCTKKKHQLRAYVLSPACIKRLQQDPLHD